MKKILKRIFTPLILSIIIGSICGKFVYKIYEQEIENKFSSDKVYLLQSGVYNSYNSMKENNMGKNYLYYLDGNMYKSVVAITKNYKNIDKIKNIYKNDLVVKEYYISASKPKTQNIISKQDEYDNKLLEENDETKEWDIINNIINLYKNNNEMKLIEVK